VFGAKTFPRIVAALSIIVAIAMTIDTIRRKHVPAADVLPPESSNWQALGTVIGALVFFILTLEWLGWLIAATVLFTLVAIGLGNRRYLSCLLGGIALASVTQIVFSGFLEINLPSGIIGGL
jgi:putative tricarboxylic transport membrane protein